MRLDWTVHDMGEKMKKIRMALGVAAVVFGGCAAIDTGNGPDNSVQGQADVVTADLPQNETPVSPPIQSLFRPRSAEAAQWPQVAALPPALAGEAELRPTTVRIEPPQIVDPGNGGSGPVAGLQYDGSINIRRVAK